MSNVKNLFNVADLKLIETDLHRKLTDEEAALVYAFGWEALFEHMGMDQEKYVAYRRLLDLIITYCTKSQIDFEKLKSSKDFSGAFALLSDFLLACYNEPIGGDFDLEEEENDCSSESSDDLLDRNEGLAVEDYVNYFIDEIPESEEFWCEEYLALDPDREALTKFVTDLYEDDEPHCVEETVGDALDVMKDYVVEKTAARLAKTNEPEKLPQVLLDEVLAYIEENWSNYTLQSVNGVIKVKKN